MKFEAMLPWALSPTKFNPDVKEARAKREMMRASFTHLRAERQPEFCPPWVQGQAIWWRVISPVDVELSPLPQVEVSAEHKQDSAAVAGKSQIWIRGGAAIALNPTAWLNSFEFEHAGERHGMFLPNGGGTIEWRLGWTVTDHENIGLLIIPSPAVPALGVEIGFLSVTTLERMQAKGVSIAVRPDQRVVIARGQEIARLIPISPEALAQ